MERINLRALRFLPYTMIAQILCALLLNLCLQLISSDIRSDMSHMDYMVIMVSVNLVLALFNFSFLWFCQFGIRKMNAWLQAAFWTGTASSVLNTLHAVVYSLIFIRITTGENIENEVIFRSHIPMELGSFLLGVSMLLTIRGLWTGIRGKMTGKARTLYLAGGWSIAAMMIGWRVWRVAEAVRRAQTDPEIPVYAWYLMYYGIVILIAGGIVAFALLLYAVCKYRQTSRPPEEAENPESLLKEGTEA